MHNCSITVVVWCTWLFCTGAISMHCSQVMSVNVSKLLLHICFSPSICPPHSFLHHATYNRSFLMRHLKKKKNPITPGKKKKKGPGVAITPPLPSSPLLLSPPTDPPQKRAKDVERWIISPRYNLTVTLRCHLLWRTALLMSSTLHVSHFPAN